MDGMDLRKDLAASMAAELTVKAVMFRETYGRQAAIDAGCVESVLALLAMFRMGLDDDGLAELHRMILGEDETDDVLAGIAVSS